ncbi:MAG: phosphate ABC transporter permease subunit PstC [Propionibacteriaceae bacterium]|jgi:phosphate transport system permease protein|uniref:Phosphate transport system permease protein n=1 Tax=Micropruina glycogenica TaxID=75385 RepID=A0A2N9JL34_9ACTN|nr:phosphate ABC transporter permease subunit PstC [Propionibacteriaceae bacterium]SPD88730.1 Phosphate transport system permease protein PstC 2 [Micropruina glycogenica]
MATVTQSTQEVTPSPSTHRPPGQRALKRMGDRVFSGLSTGSGIIILVILAMVAGFLLMQALPALITSPEVLSKQGYGPFWSWILPFAWGTVWCSFWALLMAVPVAIGIALFISHYAPRRLASGLGYVIDLLAAVPSVVFGLWGSSVLAPAVQPLWLWLNTYLGWIPFFSGQASGTGRTLLTAAIVLAVMILPIITSLSREVFLQTPVLHQEAALALGATRWEMVKMTVLPFGRAGIVSSVMLGLGRALGETMAVAMVLSGASVINLEILTSQNPNTIAAVIAQNFPEAYGLKTNMLIAGGLVLFVITLVVNMIARLIVGRYKEFSGAN